MENKFRMIACPRFHKGRQTGKGGVMTVFLFASFLVLFLGGCSTYVVSIRYEPTGQIVANAPEQVMVTVGSFTDVRGEDCDWLGASKGGAGNSLKTLRTEKPIKETVEATFADALRVRNMLGTKENSKVAIEGKIMRFDCNYYVNSEAHAYLRVNVVALSSRALLFSNVYRTDKNEWGLTSGMLGEAYQLAGFAETTLSETIDKALSDPRFIEAILKPQKINVTSSP